MAIDELRLGDINVNFTYVMMPLDNTIKCVTEAVRYADEHKYYEANLALKEAEDGLVVDANYLTEWPQWQTKPMQHQTTTQNAKTTPQKPQTSSNKTPQTTTQKPGQKFTPRPTRPADKR
jgi:hypothetical protein